MATLYKLIDNETKSIIYIRFKPGSKFKTIEEFRNVKYPTYIIENINDWKIKTFSINPGDITNNIDKNWKRIHHQIVNKLIKYCIKYNIKPDDINLYINNLNESIANGCWVPSTDSELIALDDDKNILTISI